MQRERVTDSAGVPTVWLAMFGHMDAAEGELPNLRHAIIGGSAAPRFMIERLMKLGVNVAHAWGMTETSPIGTTGANTPTGTTRPSTSRSRSKQMQGRVPFGVELRTVDLDDFRKVLPRDGQHSGALQVRGPWVLQTLLQGRRGAVDADGWFNTGDVGILHPDGTLQLTDRTKDVIKSGGEWISSVDLENAAVGHSGIAEAAAIGIPHPKCRAPDPRSDSRKPGSEVSQVEVLEQLEG